MYIYTNIPVYEMWRTMHWAMRPHWTMMGWPEPRPMGSEPVWAGGSQELVRSRGSTVGRRSVGTGPKREGRPRGARPWRGLAPKVVRRRGRGSTPTRRVWQTGPAGSKSVELGSARSKGRGPAHRWSRHRAAAGGRRQEGGGRRPAVHRWTARVWRGRVGAQAATGAGGGAAGPARRTTHEAMWTFKISNLLLSKV